MTKLPRADTQNSPMGDDPIDATDNADYIEHCADGLERCGLRVMAGALRIIADEYRALAASQPPSAPVGVEGLANHFDSVRNGLPDEWQDFAAEFSRDLRALAHQPVAAKQAQGGGELPSPLSGDFDCPKAAATRSCPCGFCRALRSAGAPAREPYCPRCDNNREVLANEADENDPACVPCPKCRPSAPVGVEEMLVVAEKAWHEHQTACRFTTVSGSLKKVCEALARQPAASVVGDARELLAQQLRKDGHATAARVVRQGEENALLTSAIKLIAALAQQPAADTVTVQQAWEWAGGNSGIKATREDLEKALRDLDAVCDDADQQPAVTNPWQFAVDSGLVTAHLGVAAVNVTREEASRQLNRLIDWHVQIATDPAVNGGLHLVPVQPGGTDNE